jgi:hypothetical protein
MQDWQYATVEKVEHGVQVTGEFPEPYFALDPLWTVDTQARWMIGQDWKVMERTRTKITLRRHRG